MNSVEQVISSADSSEATEISTDLETPVTCITLDLEDDWAIEKPGYDHLTFEYLDQFIELINRFDLPLSVFVVGETLERYPEAVEKLRTETEVEFYLHSYRHDLSKSYEFDQEISLGIEAFKSFFGRKPIGYRAPQGNIELEELRYLDDVGFQFDSSVFPSYRPGLYNNLDSPIMPYRPAGTETLIEYPIGVLPKLRIPFSQSYIKLIGRPYLWLLDRMPLPDILVFDLHLQDLYRTASHDQLETPLRQIHKRNLDNSLTLFHAVIKILRDRGRKFVTLREVHEKMA